MPFRDPIKQAEYNRQYREKRREQLAAKERERYLNGGKEKQTAYRRAHLEQYAAYQRQSRHLRPKDHLVAQAKYRAKRDSLPFDISVETIKWPTHCPVLGIELDYNRPFVAGKALRTNAPTLDRKTNDKGYVVENVFVISHRANRIKSDATPAEIEALFKYATLPLP